MSAVTDWKLIYSDYSTEDLDAEIAALRKLTTGGFVSQTVGGKSYSREPGQLRTQLAAATEVKQQRGNGESGRSAWDGVVSFTGVDGQPGTR